MPIFKPGVAGAIARAREDIATVLQKDPAPRSRYEVLLYPHTHALWIYRLAHRYYRNERIFTARALSLFGRWISGIDIHPGAEIGRRFFIDHGAGVVIGETARIGDDVMLYHRVTLGATGWWHDMERPPGSRRHPVLEDGVIVGEGASVLGPVTIGAGSLIGAHSLVLESVPAGSRVSAGARASARSAGAQLVRSSRAKAARTARAQDAHPNGSADPAVRALASTARHAEGA
ncbi:MAG: serine O-acetyltransferase EpsC [Trebonia sp.]